MWRGPVNSAVLATTTHRRWGGMSDGTSTQVRVQIINKCKALMASRRLYKKGSPYEEEGGEKKGVRIEEQCKNHSLPTGTHIHSPRLLRLRIYGCEGDLLSFNYCIAQL